jgi:hypothetical protein
MIALHGHGRRGTRVGDIVSVRATPTPAHPMCAAAAAVAAAGACCSVGLTTEGMERTLSAMEKRISSLWMKSDMSISSTP